MIKAIIYQDRALRGISLLATNMLVLLALLPEEATNSFYKIGGVFFICLLLVLGSSYSMVLSFINKEKGEICYQLKSSILQV
ncbi:hypothetical protein BD408DRAFT_410574, partial [Parasitella parasitica]